MNSDNMIRIGDLLEYYMSSWSDVDTIWLGYLFGHNTFL